MRRAVNQRGVAAVNVEVGIKVVSYFQVRGPNQVRQKRALTSVMTSKPTISSPRKRRYDEAFRAEALRLASESRSTQAAARQLGINSKLIYKWQKATQPVLEVGSGEAKAWPCASYGPKTDACSRSAIS